MASGQLIKLEGLNSDSNIIGISTIKQSVVTILGNTKAKPGRVSADRASSSKSGGIRELLPLEAAVKGEIVKS